MDHLQIKSRERIAGEGVAARASRIPVDHNPYPDTSEAHQLWANAWAGKYAGAQSRPHEVRS